jgi:transcriptional regulator with XRE-family HTH domain
VSHRLHTTNLREVAAQNGDLTDYRIAQRAGIPRATLSRLVNGQGEPTISTLMRLAACYRMSIESLVREADTPVAA